MPSTWHEKKAKAAEAAFERELQNTESNFESELKNDTKDSAMGKGDDELFEKKLYKSGDDVYNLMCGPPIMLDKGCTPNLVALGHSKQRIFAF